MDGRQAKVEKLKNKIKETAECDLKNFKLDFRCEFDAFCILGEYPPRAFGVVS
jgi:hypothetical protein